jgi:hypothetical protein
VSTDLDFLGSDPETAPLPVAGQHSDLDFLGPDAQDHPDPVHSGFLDYWGRAAKSYYLLSLANTRDDDLMNILASDATKKERDLYRVALSQRRNDAGVTMAVRDMMKIGDIARSTWADVKGAFSSEGLSQSFRHPFDTVGGVALALTKPANELMEVISGLDLSSGEHRRLLPEEQAERYKDIVGAVAGFGATEIAGAAMKSVGFTTVAERMKDIAKDVKTLKAGGSDYMLAQEALNELRTKVWRPGELAKGSVQGAIKGGAFGGVQSLVRYSGEDSQLQEVITNGIVMAPLGAAFHLVGGPGAEKVNEGARMAQKLWRVRVMNDIFNQSPKGTLTNIESFATANSLLQAVVDGHIELGDKEMLHIPGVNVRELGELGDVAKGSKVIIGPVDGDGNANALVVGKKAAKDFFREGTESGPDIEAMKRTHDTLVSKYNKLEKRNATMAEYRDILPQSEIDSVIRAHGGDPIDLQKEMHLSESYWKQVVQGYIDQLSEPLAEAEKKVVSIQAKNLSPAQFYQKTGWVRNGVVSYEGKMFAVRGFSEPIKDITWSPSIREEISQITDRMAETRKTINEIRMNQYEGSPEGARMARLALSAETKAELMKLSPTEYSKIDWIAKLEEEINSLMVQRNEVRDRGNALYNKVKGGGAAQIESLATGRRLSVAWDEIRAHTSLIIAEPDMGLIGTRVLNSSSVMYPSNDTGMLRMHHGTSAAFPEWDETKLNPESLYGPGFYFTEDPKTAEGYAKTHRGPAIPTHEEVSAFFKPGEIRTLHGYQVRVLSYEMGHNGLYEALLQDVDSSGKDTVRDPWTTQAFPTDYDLEAAGVRELTHRPNIHFVRLLIKNPFDIDAKYSKEQVEQMWDDLQKHDPRRKVLTAAGHTMPEIQDKEGFVQDLVGYDEIVSGQDLYVGLTEYMGFDKQLVNEFLQNSGYDGITHVGGARTGNIEHRVFIAFSKDQIKPAFDTFTPVSKATAQRALNTAYMRFTQQLKTYHEPPPLEPEEMDRRLALMKEKYPDREDSVNKGQITRQHKAHPANIADVILPDDFSYNKAINDFFKKEGYAESDIPGIKKEFEKRFVEELTRDEITPEEKAFHEKIGQMARKSAAAEKDFSAATVVRRATSNGMTIDVAEAGRLTLRDRESGNELFTGSAREVTDFINKSGESKGIDLDSGSPVPPGGGLSDLWDVLDDNDPHPNIIGKQGKVADLFDTLNLSATFFTPFREWFLSVDKRFGTDTYNKIFYALQMARRTSNAAMHPFYKALKDIEKPLLKWPKEMREQVLHYMETKTLDQVKAGADPVEIQLAEKIAARNIDLKKVFDYETQLGIERVKGEISPEKQNEIITNLGLTKQELQMHDTLHGTTGTTDLNVGRVARIARAIKDPTGALSQADFARQNNMSGEQIAVAERLTSMHTELAKKFGIDIPQLFDVLTHARVYNDGQVLRALDAFGGDKVTRKFVEEMFGTGELSAWDLDPIHRTQRLIKSGHDAVMFNPAKTEAMKAFGVELKKLPANFQGKAAANMKMYFSDIQGHPGASQMSTQAVVDSMFEKWGWDNKINLDVRQHIVNVISATGEAAAQGFRVAAGVRDFTTGVTLFYSRFGAERTVSMITKGARAMMNGERTELEEAGTTTGATPVAFADPIDLLGSRLGSVKRFAAGRFQDFTNLSFKLSGQKDVYAMLHAGAYLDTWKLSGDNLAKFREGRITLQQLGKNMKLSSYDTPVQKEYLRLVQEDKDIEASRYLGIQTGYDQIGVYGFANHPVGWSSNVGRIAGQFGQWPMWLRANLQRLASRGTWGERTGNIARLVAAQKIMMLTGAAAGFNLNTWRAETGLIFAGGPMVNAYQTVSQAMSGYGYRQRSAMTLLKSAFKFDLDDPTTLGHIWLPGSFFARDLARAYHAATHGHANPLQMLGQGAGLQLSDDPRGQLNDAIRYPLPGR